MSKRLIINSFQKNTSRKMEMQHNSGQLCTRVPFFKGFMPSTTLKTPFFDSIYCITTSQMSGVLKLYLLHGGIYEISHIPFSYYPMNLDLLYLIPLAFNNDIAPKFIHFAFALITAFMIFRYLSRRTGPACAWLGALFFLILPVIVRLSSTVYVDLGLICFFFAALLYLFDWIESGFKPRPLIISGIFCGLALGTKYNGLVGLFLLGLFVPFVYARICAGTRHVSLKAAAWGGGVHSGFPAGVFPLDGPQWGLDRQPGVPLV
jgi:dolichyl-phosphate-mannose--protein O-mannosyl transferase